jgi:hypothetical protein
MTTRNLISPPGEKNRVFQYELLRKTFAAKLLRRGYKYRLTQDYEIILYNTPLTKGVWHKDDDSGATIELLRLLDAGMVQAINRPFVLRISKGYPWDGPSGPTRDTPNNVEGSLPHDALYELLREGKLPQSCREWADQVAHEIWRDTGFALADVWYYGLRWFAGYAARRRK